MSGTLGIVRLKGAALTALRENCFHRDKWRCTECGRRVYRSDPEWSPKRAHMAHVIGRGRGGPDTVDNVTTKCGGCHMVEEHHPKSVRSK